MLRRDRGRELSGRGLVPLLRYLRLGRQIRVVPGDVAEELDAIGKWVNEPAPRTAASVEPVDSYAVTARSERSARASFRSARALRGVRLGRRPILLGLGEGDLRLVVLLDEEVETSVELCELRLCVDQILMRDGGMRYPGSE